MIIETMETANLLHAKIALVAGRLKLVNDVIADSQGASTVSVRLKGMNLTLPKAALRTQVLTQKTALEAELTVLQNEFDSL